MENPPKSRPLIEHFLAGLLIAAAILSCFHKLVIHPSDVLVGPQSGGENDLVNYYIPSRTFLRDSIIKDGTIQFWNPYLAFGTAYIGNAQSAAYYPPNWLTIIFNPTWFLSWLQLLHHWWIGLGLYFLCRSQGLDFGCSLFGGISLACAPFFIAQGAEGHYAQIAAVSWIPWAFLGFNHFLKKQTLRSQAILAACFAMSFFCGHVQETYYLVLMLSLLLLWEVVQALRQGEKTRSGQLLSSWTVIGLLTIGLVAIDLVPIYFNSQTTPRGLSAIDASQMGWDAFSVNHFWQLIDPFAIDRPDKWLRGTPPFWEKLGYFGIVPFCLALLAMVFGRTNRSVLQVSIILFVTFLIALGTNSFLFPLMLKAVPGTTWFRLPSRIFFLTSFCVAFLAAHGLQMLRGDQPPRVLKGLALLAILASSAIIGKNVTDTGVLSLSAICFETLLLVPLLLLAIIVLQLFLRGDWSRWAGAALIILSVSECSLLANKITETAKVYSLGERNVELANTLQQITVDGKMQRVLTVQELLSDQDAITMRIPKARGYDPASSLFYNMLIYTLSLDSERPIDPTGFSQVRLEDLSPRFLNAAGVSHALQVRRKSFTQAPEGWKIIWSGVLEKRVQRRSDGAAQRYPVDLLENLNVLPRSFVVRDSKITNNREDPRLTVKGTDFKQTVLLMNGEPSPAPPPYFKAVDKVQQSPDQLELTLPEVASGYLLLNGLYFPGWTCSVDGEQTELLQGNFSFRAIQIPGGAERVTLHFESPGFKVGLLLTCLTLVLWLVVVVRPPRTSPLSA